MLSVLLLATFPVQASRLALSEADACRGASLVVIGVVQPDGSVYVDNDFNGAIISRQTVQVERTLFVADSAPAEERRSPLIVEVPGNWVTGTPTIVGFPDWTPGTRHLLLLLWLEETDRTAEGWFRILDRVLPSDGEPPPIDDLQYFWSLHCSEYRADTPERSPGWWTWWYDDPFIGAGLSECGHK